MLKVIKQILKKKKTNIVQISLKNLTDHHYADFTELTSDVMRRTEES